jgi:hypothetical protein
MRDTSFGGCRPAVLDVVNVNGSAIVDNR